VAEIRNTLAILFTDLTNRPHPCILQISNLTSWETRISRRKFFLGVFRPLVGD